MGRAPCCENTGLKKGPWTPEEDQKLVAYIQEHGHSSWRALPKKAGLLRCGKSCRLRWTNYLRPDIKRGKFSFEEEHAIVKLHAMLGNRWSAIASHLPGRTDNEIKNYWNTHLKKVLLQIGIDPVTHMPLFDSSNHTSMISSTLHQIAQWENARLEAEARLTREYFKFATSPLMAETIQENFSSDFLMKLWKSRVDNYRDPDQLRTMALDQRITGNMDLNYFLRSWEQSPQWATPAFGYTSSTSATDSDASATPLLLQNFNSQELKPPIQTQVFERTSPTSVLCPLGSQALPFPVRKSEVVYETDIRFSVHNLVDSQKLLGSRYQCNQSLHPNEAGDHRPICVSATPGLALHGNTVECPSFLPNMDSSEFTKKQNLGSWLVQDTHVLSPEQPVFPSKKAENFTQQPTFTSNSASLFNDTASTVNSSSTSISSSTYEGSLSPHLLLDNSNLQHNMLTTSTACLTVSTIEEDANDYWSNIMKLVGPGLPLPCMQAVASQN